MYETRTANLYKILVVVPQLKARSLPGPRPHFTVAIVEASDARALSVNGKDFVKRENLSI